MVCLDLRRTPQIRNRPRQLHASQPRPGDGGALRSAMERTCAHAQLRHRGTQPRQTAAGQGQALAGIVERAVFAHLTRSHTCACVTGAGISASHSSGVLPSAPRTPRHGSWSTTLALSDAPLGQSSTCPEQRQTKTWMTRESRVTGFGTQRNGLRSRSTGALLSTIRPRLVLTL